MKPVIGLLWVILLSTVSQAEAGPCGLTFCYDSKSGSCRDQMGNPGYNKIGIDQLIATKNGQCGDFSRLVFPYDVEDDSEPYSNLDLQGATLAHSKLEQMYKRVTGKFEGADLSKLSFYYISVIGEVDAFTKLPTFCKPTAKEGLPPGIFFINCSH